MRVWDWQEVAEHECGAAYDSVIAHCAVSFGDPCKRCGEKMKWNNTKFRVARAVSNSIWYKPWTWLSKHVEYK